MFFSSPGFGSAANAWRLAGRGLDLLFGVANLLVHYFISRTLERGGRFEPRRLLVLRLRPRR
jgi:hypothetical protein